MKPKILWYTAMHGRHEVVEIMLAAFQECKRTWKHDLDMDIFITATSDEDCQFLDDRNIFHTRKENKPIGRKFSQGLNEALALNWDYVMVLGSDDVIHPDLFAYYIPQIEDGNKYFGTDTICILDPPTKRAKHFTIPPNNRIGVCGPGRMIHRDIVKHFNGYLWPAEDRGLALFSNMRITSYAELKTVTLQDSDWPLMWDVKSDSNIWAYNKVIDYITETEYQEQVDRMPEPCKQLLNERRIRQAI